MAFKMIRDLTWQTLTMVTTVWAIAGYLGDIEANSATPPAPKAGAHADAGTSNESPAVLEEAE